MMFQGLNDYNLSEKATDDDKLSFFTKVNKSVALKLNHKKGVTEAQKKSLKKDQDELDDFQKKLKKEEDKKVKLKIKEKLNQKRLKFENKKEKLGLALDTSKKNYIDPRIIKSWCENVDLPITKIYNTKTFQKYFEWVIEDDSINSEWNYNDTELDCIVGSELFPKTDDKDMVMPARYPQKNNKSVDLKKLTRECLDERTKEDLFKIIDLLGLPLIDKENTKKNIIEYILSKSNLKNVEELCKSFIDEEDIPLNKLKRKSARKSTRTTRKSTRTTRKSTRTTRKSTRTTRKSTRTTRKSPIKYNDEEDIPLNKLKRK
jgi:hypothetical protein